MKYEGYRKPTNWKGGNGMTKGVKSAPMKTMFVEGMNPYADGQVVLVKFKGVETVAQCVNVNEQSITVEIKGIDNKKVIRFSNVIKIVG